jgi:hypothetical protein
LNVSLRLGYRGNAIVSIAFLYLLKYTDVFRRENFEEDLQDFVKIYPPFEPGNGMADFVRDNWAAYAAGTCLNAGPQVVDGEGDLDGPDCNVQAPY